MPHYPIGAYKGKRRKTYPMQKRKKKPSFGVKTRTAVIKMAEKKVKTAGLQLFTGTLGSVTRLTGIAIGDGPNEREGNSVRLQHLKCRLQIKSQDTPFNTVRVIFFKYHESGNPTVSEILRTADVPTIEWLAQYDYFKRNQYTVLTDKTFVVDDDDPTLTYQYNKYFKSGGLRIDYDGAGVNSLAVNNDIYMLVITDSVAIGHPEVALSYQLLYADI